MINEEKLKEQFEHALHTHEEGTGQLFLYSFFDFSFQYDEKAEIVHIEMPISEIMYNPIGFLHGGILTYIADTAMGHLCAAFADQPGVSLELKTQFYRSVKTGVVKAKAYFVKKGKKVQFIECILEDDQERLLGKVTSTFYSIDS